MVNTHNILVNYRCKFESILLVKFTQKTFKDNGAACCIIAKLEIEYFRVPTACIS